jgi:hypothetical protein
MAGMAVKTFESPDEVQPSEGKGKADVLDIGGRVWIARRWSPAGGGGATSSPLRDRSRGIAPRPLSAGPDEGDQGDGNEPSVFIESGEFGEYARRVRLGQTSWWRARRYAGAASCAATSASWRKDMPITAFWPSRSSW